MGQYVTETVSHMHIAWFFAHISIVWLLFSFIRIPNRNWRNSMTWSWRPWEVHFGDKRSVKHITSWNWRMLWVPEGECCLHTSNCAVLLCAVIFVLSKDHLNKNSQPVLCFWGMAMRLVRPQNWSYHCGKVNTTSFCHKWIHGLTSTSP
jgi:hypothetical protein